MLTGSPSDSSVRFGMSPRRSNPKSTERHIRSKGSSSASSLEASPVRKTARNELEEVLESGKKTGTKALRAISVAHRKAYREENDLPPRAVFPVDGMEALGRLITASNSDKQINVDLYLSGKGRQSRDASHSPPPEKLDLENTDILEVLPGSSTAPTKDIASQPAIGNTLEPDLTGIEQAKKPTLQLPKARIEPALPKIPMKKETPLEKTFEAPDTIAADPSEIPKAVEPPELFTSYTPTLSKEERALFGDVQENKDGKPLVKVPVAEMPVVKMQERPFSWADDVEKPAVTEHLTEPTTVKVESSKLTRKRVGNLSDSRWATTTELLPSKESTGSPWKNIQKPAKIDGDVRWPMLGEQPLQDETSKVPNPSSRSPWKIIPRPPEATAAKEKVAVYEQPPHGIPLNTMIASAKADVPDFSQPGERDRLFGRFDLPASILKTFNFRLEQETINLKLPPNELSMVKKKLATYAFHELEAYKGMQEKGDVKVRNAWSVKRNKEKKEDFLAYHRGDNFAPFNSLTAHNIAMQAYQEAAQTDFRIIETDLHNSSKR